MSAVSPAVLDTKSLAYWRDLNLALSARGRAAARAADADRMFRSGFAAPDAAAILAFGLPVLAAPILARAAQ